MGNSPLCTDCYLRQSGGSFFGATMNTEIQEVEAAVVPAAPPGAPSIQLPSGGLLEGVLAIVVLVKWVFNDSGSEKGGSNINITIDREED